MTSSKEEHETNEKEAKNIYNVSKMKNAKNCYNTNHYGLKKLFLAVTLVGLDGQEGHAFPLQKGVKR